MTIKQQGGIFGRNPTFNDVDVEGTLTVNGEPISDFGTMAQQDADAVAITGGSGAFDTFSADTDTLYVDAPNDRVGINTSNPTTAFQVNTGAGGFGTFMHSSGAGGVRISGSAGASGANLILANNFNTALDDRWAFSLNGGNDALSIASGGVAPALGGSGTERITVDTSGNMSLITGNLVVTSGKGIDFSATSGTGTSELFDDYEEGTFTPDIVGSVSAGAGTYAYRIGRYTKIGDRVLFNLIMSWSAHTGTGFMRIDGLPFTSMASSPYYHAVNIGYIDNVATTAGTVPAGFIVNNSTQMWMGQIPTGGGAWSYMGIDTAGNINISGQYEV